MASPARKQRPTRISRATEKFRWDEEAGRWLCIERVLVNLFRGGEQLNFS
jgi:hypothetical protein